MNISAYEKYQEGSASPEEGGDGGEICGLLKNFYLFLSDLHHLVFKRLLPRVQFQHLQIQCGQQSLLNYSQLIIN